MPRPARPYGALQLGLDLDTEELDRRVERRVTRMFDDGLVDEAGRSRSRDLRTAARRPARSATSRCPT